MEKFELDKIYILDNNSYICKNRKQDIITFYNTKTSTTIDLKCFNYHDETEIIIYNDKIYTPKYSKYFIRFEIDKIYKCDEILIKLIDRNENNAIFETVNCAIESYSGTKILKFKQAISQNSTCEYFYIAGLYGKNLKFLANIYE